MMNNEGIQTAEIRTSFLEQEEVIEFLKDRGIHHEDYQLIEEISFFPKDFFFDFHNFFTLSRDRSERELQKLIINLDGEKKVFAEKLLKCINKYHFTTVHHLIRILERI